MYERSCPIIAISIRRYNLGVIPIDYFSIYCAILANVYFCQYVQFGNLFMLSASENLYLINTFLKVYLFEFKCHGPGLAKIALHHVLYWARCGLAI